eukprot:CAMPEP_0171672074 /NCGR_PEP_ID=MMETSP0990-20121206/51765_1 /TAXON_ID=483369 /ORGANISM="non described non described, Strain CCMP2098" /LENGTH=120 /DNA_ID=CAMNT_0012257279 /DNA_START=228 /DNA_END=590 /DNA_ORIENTATION=+
MSATPSFSIFISFPCLWILAREHSFFPREAAAVFERPQGPKALNVGRPLAHLANCFNGSARAAQKDVVAALGADGRRHCERLDCALSLSPGCFRQNVCIVRLDFRGKRQITHSVLVTGPH